MNPRKPFYRLCCLLLILFGQGLLSKVQSQTPADCTPTIEGQHYQVYCLDEAQTGSAPAPVAQAACGRIAQFNYKERFIDLECDQTGFQGYFEPSNWTIAKILGDGGVDVTGAPNPVLVEGANHSLVSVTPGGVSRMKILIPADGMIAFDWRNVGGSNLFPKEFSLFINEEAYALSEKSAARGRFRRPVRKGDELRLEFRAQEARTIELQRFRLLSNTQSVIERRWTATDEGGRSNSFTQFIAIEQPSIADVRFPGGDAVQASPKAIAPEHTGYPFIDRDGDPATSADRYVLTGKQCGLQVEYADEIQQLGDECLVYRHWVITDDCGDTTLKETQIIKLIKTPEAGDCPADSLFSSPEQRSEQPNIPENSSYGLSAEQPTHGQDHPDPMTL